MLRCDYSCVMSAFAVRCLEKKKTFNRKIRSCLAQAFGSSKQGNEWESSDLCASLVVRRARLRNKSTGISLCASCLIEQVDALSTSAPSCVEPSEEPSPPGASSCSGSHSAVVPSTASRAVGWPVSASSLGLRFYTFRPEHGLGAVVGCTWAVARQLWRSAGVGRAPKGYDRVEDAIAASFGLFPDATTIELKRA